VTVDPTRLPERGRVEIDLAFDARDKSYQIISLPDSGDLRPAASISTTSIPAEK
jgi:hypothetical protein